VTLAETTRPGAQEELREAISSAQPADWRTGDATADDPAQGASWNAQRTVLGTLLADLLTNTDWLRRPRALRLAGARIIGRLELEATELVCPLLLEDCWFAEPVILVGTQAPSVRLPGCHLPGLLARQLTTRGDLELSHGFTASGEVRLAGARIGGQLVLDGATLTNPNGRALTADRVTAEEGMFCRQGFSATGEVSLRGARIGGQLVFEGATLTNPDGRALTGDGVIVEQGMFCGQGFSATGEVSLRGAQIGGQLVFEGANLTNPNGRALNLSELRARSLFLLHLTQPLQVVNFSQAQVGVLVDDPGSWPREAYLDGFVYGALDEYSQVTARQRLLWLTSDPRGYSPQPYEQLAAVYRRAGRDQDAQTVNIAKERARRRTLPWAGRLWSLLVDGVIGHGYRAGLWLASWLIASALVYSRAYPHQLTPAHKPDEPIPDFNPMLYGLDVLLPVIDLEQQKYWIPHGFAQWWTWVSVLAGLVLTTVLVTGFTEFLQARLGNSAK
jgi:hypothetical protein